MLGRDIAVTLPLITELVPHMGESVEDLPTTLFETAPTVLFTVPRYLQKIGVAESWSASPAPRASSASPTSARWRFARGHVKRRWTGAAERHARGDACDVARARYSGPILNKIGFDKLELVVSGGAPLPAETMAVWHMLGVNVVEMYGQTETAGGIIAGQRGPVPAARRRGHRARRASR